MRENNNLFLPLFESDRPEWLKLMKNKKLISRLDIRFAYISEPQGSFQRFGVISRCRAPFPFPLP